MAKVLVLHHDSRFRSQINLMLATNSHDVIGSDYTEETPSFPVDAAIIEVWCDRTGLWANAIRHIKETSPRAKILGITCCYKAEMMAYQAKCDAIVDMPHIPNTIVQQLELLFKK